jgi:hypothetical protein
LRTHAARRLWGPPFHPESMIPQHMGCMPKLFNLVALQMTIGKRRKIPMNEMTTSLDGKGRASRMPKSQLQSLTQSLSTKRVSFRLLKSICQVAWAVLPKIALSCCEEGAFRLLFASSHTRIFVRSYSSARQDQLKGQNR